MFNSFNNNFLLNLVKGKPGYIIASSILSLSSAVFNAIAIILLLPILFTILNSDVAIISADFSAFIRYCLALSDALNLDSKLTVSIVSAVLALVISIVTAYLSSLASIKYTKYLIYEIKQISFNLLSKADVSYYSRHKTGDILFKINREIDKAALTVKTSQKILITSTIILFFSIVLFLVSPRLALITIVLITLSYGINSYISDRLKNKNLLLSQKSHTYNYKTIEFLTGISHIKNTANEAAEYQGIIKSIAAKNKAEFNTQAISALINPANEILGIVIILVLTFTSYYLYEQQIQVFLPILLVYLLILFKLLPLIGQLNNARRQFANNKSSIEMVTSFLNEVNKSTIKSGKTVFAGFKNNIELHNITFAYPHHAQIVLDKVNLKIIKGSTTALVGSPGAGKSSLVSLLSRLYEPIEGKITIDDRDIEEYELSSLRKSIAVINPEPFLFNESIFNNLTYGLDNISESEVIAATKKTKAYDFILKLADGFDAQIDSRELKISELERQLIAITRALISNPAIVVLDESMKNISKSDRGVVQNALDELCRDRTTIVITNRLATIKKADQIIILNKGRIIESGTHQELLENGNLYKRMCSAQFKTSQQSHQQLLAKKISKKLSHQANSSLSYEIRNNLNSLLNYLQLVNEGLVDDDLEQERILDESYQSAKDMLASLREYERKIARGLEKNNEH